MADVTMYSLLPTATADYETTTLSIPCTVYGPEDGGKNVQILEGDDGLVDAVVHSTVASFVVSVDYVNISATNQSTLFDFYHDSAKGNCGGRTIKFLHPSDGHTYVARFIGRLKREFHQTGNYYTYRGVSMRLEGKYA